ncbi:hypothetical protein QUB75_14045 [Microcoleus sp. K1-B6]
MSDRFPPQRAFLLRPRSRRFVVRTLSPACKFYFAPDRASGGMGII